MSETLILVAKDGAKMRVHPTALDAHTALGWAVSPDQSADRAPEPAGLDGMTIAELRARAIEEEIDLNGATKKPEIIAALEAGMAAKAAVIAAAASEGVGDNTGAP
jgi:hypothetical protein